MTHQSGEDRPSNLFSWIRRILRRPPRIQLPPVQQGEQDLDLERVRVQLEVIQRAFDGQVVVARPEKARHEGEIDYLCRPDHVLVRRRDEERLRAYFGERKDIYPDAGEEVREPAPDLLLYRVPKRRDRGSVLATLDEIERDLGKDVATPDHIVYLTHPVGSMCPATEPEEPGRSGPVPPPAQDPGEGEPVSVSVVDSGWYPGAATDTDSPWLATGVDGDVENVNPAALGPYAGHGTFVAGVVRCMAPRTTIEVEGALVNGGAVYESDIVQQLDEAVLDRTDPPQVISISAGTHSRNGQPLLSFLALAEARGLDKGEGPLIVAAAGNDGHDDPFWPAAFDWVVGVGALDVEGSVCDFSNYGSWVDVYAHGKDLVNAYPTGTYTCYEPLHAGEVRHFTGLARWSGTSFSTPIVSGLIAAYVSQNGGSAHDAWAAIKAGALAQTDPRVGAIKVVGPPFA